MIISIIIIASLIIAYGFFGYLIVKYNLEFIFEMFFKKKEKIKNSEKHIP